MINTIPPQLDFIPKDESSLSTFGTMLNKLWQKLSLTLAPVFNVAGSYIPVITSNTGVFTTVSATGRFSQFGRFVFVKIEITITINGTAAGFVTATLPVSAIANYILVGRENIGSGRILQGITSSIGTVNILNDDNTYPGANGTVLIISGYYEAS